MCADFCDNLRYFVKENLFTGDNFLNLSIELYNVDFLSVACCLASLGDLCRSFHRTKRQTISISGVKGNMSTGTAFFIR